MAQRESILYLDILVSDLTFDKLDSDSKLSVSIYKSGCLNLNQWNLKHNLFSPSFVIQDNSQLVICFKEMSQIINKDNPMIDSFSYNLKLTSEIFIMCQSFQYFMLTHNTPLNEYLTYIYLTYQSTI